MKIIASFVSIWAEGTVTTEATLELLNGKLSLSNVGVLDECNEYVHLEKEKVEVPMPDGSVYDLEVEDGYLVADQEQGLLNAIMASSEKPDWYEVSFYNMAGSETKVVLGTEIQVDDWAESERDQYGFISSSIEKLDCGDHKITTDLPVLSLVGRR